MTKTDVIHKATAYSVVHKQKLTFLWEAVEKAPIGDIVEIGCYKGGSSLVLSYSANTHSPSSNVFICDTFKGIALAGANDNHHKDGDFSDTSKQRVGDLLSSNGLSNFVLIEGIFPDDSSHLVDTNTISVLHIDVDVYEGYKRILHWAQERLVPGAIVIFDDYSSKTCEGAKQAVLEYFKDRTDFELHLFDGEDSIPEPSWAVFKG